MSDFLIKEHLEGEIFVPNMISEEGWRQIWSKVYDKYKFDIDELLEKEWITKRGTFPKRLMSLLKKNKIEFKPVDISVFGQIAREHSGSGITYKYRFRDPVQMREGEYQDEGSCYWGENSGAREVLSDNCGWGFCIESPVKARCWVVSKQKPVSFFVFNGYGYSTLHMARILSEVIGLPYQQIILTNNDSDTGLIYMNNCGKAYILCRSVPAKDTPYDLEIATEDYSYPYHCASCDAGLYESDIYWVNSEPYCSSCGEDSSECNSCRDYFWNDSMTFIEEADYCPRCVRNSSYARCCECDENFFMNHISQTPNGEYICENCVEHCTRCNEPYKSDELTNGVCEKCEAELEAEDEVVAVDKESI